MSNDILKILKKFLKSITFPFGWEWRNIDRRPDGRIYITLKNAISNKIAKIELSEKDKEKPCYATTRIFNIAILSENEMTLFEEEETKIADF